MAKHDRQREAKRAANEVYAKRFPCRDPQRRRRDRAARTKQRDARWLQRMGML